MSRIKNFMMTQMDLNGMMPDEFEDYIYKLLSETGVFSSIQKRASGVDLKADAVGFRGNPEKKYYLEIKSLEFVGQDVISHLHNYYQSVKDGQFILIISGTLSNEAKLIVDKFQLLVWDIYTIHNLSEYKVTEEDIYSLFINKPRIQNQSTKELELITELSNLTPGPKHWSAFQKLSSDILEHLFCPRLEPPRYEYTDKDKKNRRDMIFENSVESGFWQSIRETYKAFYIVVDAKNYSAPLKKHPIIELAHYLKPYGCGMFGIIVSRKGNSDSAHHAIKEQWVGNEKMIISLSDSDIIEMLKIKESGGNPEELIRRKIADFRTSL